MPDLAIEPELRSATCSSRSRSRSPAPFSAACEHALPVSRKEPPHRPTLPCLDAPRGPPRHCRQDASHRLLQPTFRHEHPTPIARLPSPQLSPQRPRPLSEPQPFGPEPLREHGVGPSLRPARFRSRGRAIQPQVKQRLTALPKLQPALPILPLAEGNRVRPRAIPTSTTAFSAVALAEDQTSDAPVAPRDSPGCPGLSRRT